MLVLIQSAVQADGHAGTNSVSCACISAVLLLATAKSLVVSVEVSMSAALSHLVILL